MPAICRLHWVHDETGMLASSAVTLNMHSISSALMCADRWKDAAQFYGRASDLAPAFSFAAANRALALYQLGERDASQSDQAVREMRCALL